MELTQVLPLSPQFRLVHEPFGSHPDELWSGFVGREDEVADLAGRISLSRGGAFLITGYRGVGKTSFVNRVLTEVTYRLESLPRDAYDVIVARLNFSRPTTGIELMYHLIREVYAALMDKGIFERLDAEARADLQLAVSRTSLSMAMTSLQERESSAELSDLFAKLPLAGALPGIKLSTRSKRAQTRQYTFLAYDEKSAEQDLIRLGRRLSAASYGSGRWWPPTGRRRRRLKIILVFDELDKLESDSPDSRPLDETLDQLKGLFTTSGVTFLFVAGRDLYDRWLDDLALGNSIYESVFTDARYLPALWSDADGICDALAGIAVSSAEPPQAYRDFRKYLAYQGRGIPRRIVRGFNNYVSWTPSGAVLSFSANDERAFAFYAGLYDLMVSNEERMLPEIGADLVSRRSDQRRLGLYYTADWALSQGETPFTVDQLVAGALRLNPQLAPDESGARDLAQRLLARLVEHGYVERVAAETVAIRLGEDGAAPAGLDPDRYRVEPGKLVEMGSRRSSIAESRVQDSELRLFVSRYAIDRRVATGGMSTVYEAHDQVSGRRVALKVLFQRPSDPEFEARFDREVQVLRSLDHPAIASLYDYGVYEGSPYLVLEFIDGMPLSNVIAGEGLEESAVVSIASAILNAVAFIHQKGVLWRDAKPSNVVLRADGSVALLDFGVSALLGDQHDGTLLIGTPAYLAPELIAGSPPTVLSDIYAIGVMLYEMLVGEAPFSSTSLSTESFLNLLEVKRGSPPLPSWCRDVSPALEAVVVRAMQPEREARWASAEEMLKRLNEVAISDARSAADAYVASANSAKRDVDATVYAPGPWSIERRMSAPVAVAGSSYRESSPHTDDVSSGSVPHVTAEPGTLDSAGFCSQCGAARVLGERFCSTCGADRMLETQPQIPNSVNTAPAPSGEAHGDGHFGETIVVPVPDWNPTLQHIDADQPESTIRLPSDGPWVLGRGRASTVLIDDVDASRRHAEITRRDGRFWLRDLNTLNGTEVDGKRIRNDERPLRSGSLIRIGTSRLRFVEPPGGL